MRPCSIARSSVYRIRSACSATSSASSSPRVVMIIAPTIDSRTARLFRSAWWEFNSRNLHYFSADTLQSLLIKNGFGDPIIDGDDSAVSLSTSVPRFLRCRRFLSVDAHTSRVGDATTPAAPGVPLFEQQASSPRPLQTGCCGAEAVGDRSGVQRTGDILDTHGPPAQQIDRGRGHRDPARRKQLDGRHREDAERYGDASPRATHPAGPAARQGLRREGRLAACTGDVVLFQDADLEYDIDDYDDLIAPLLAYRRNFVIGSRHVSKGRSLENSPVQRLGAARDGLQYRSRVLSRAVQLHVPTAAEGSIQHVQGLSTRLPVRAFTECNRFDFDFEIVIKLLRKGYRPLELPVNYRARSPREGKKVTMVRDPLTWIRALLKFRWGPLYQDKV